MVKKLAEYIEDLEVGKEERPEQVKQGLEIYIEMWKRAIENGVVEGTDDMEVALRKVDARGGLQQAAE